MRKKNEKKKEKMIMVQAAVMVKKIDAYMCPDCKSIYKTPKDAALCCGEWKVQQ